MIHSNGSNNQNFGNITGNITINNTPSLQNNTGYFLSNSGNPILIVDTPDFMKATHPTHHLGVAIKGTKVELLESKPDPNNPIFSWSRIKVLDGNQKGKIGWVSTGVIEKR